MKRNFNYLSRDGLTQIHAIEWKPEGEIRAVLQICHGMAEYIDRYDAFARFMTGRGFCVIGHDHLGHGESVQGEELYGYFHETKGNEYVIGDIHKLRQETQKRYPDAPYFMLGHSMGSFLIRQYMNLYGRGLAGVIVMGTGSQPGIVVAAGRLMCRVIAAFKGWNYRSRLIDGMAFGSYNKRFEPARTSKDWLTKDEKTVDDYLANPWCSFIFTVNAYYHMFCGMQAMTKKKNMLRIQKNLPVFFVAGADDPVGNFGKGVRQVCEKYEAWGMKDVGMKLYEKDRHEILNETDKETVYEDLAVWMEERLFESNSLK